MRPEVVSSQPWQFPQPDIRHLSNQLTVWLFDLPGQQIGACDLVMPISLGHEPRDIEGVGAVTLGALDEGTLSHPDGRIAELLELQGASVTGAAEQTTTRISMDAPMHRLDSALGLLMEMVREPAFDETAVERHKEWQIAAYQSRMASAPALAQAGFVSAIFGDDVRQGRPPAGTPETISAITPETVRRWHQRHYSPVGATLVIAGDLSLVDMDAALAQCEPWSGNHSLELPEPTARPPRRILIDRPESSGSAQATMHIGCLSVGRQHPDWAALRLAGHAIAGAFASRLNVELRERRGITYGVSGGFATRRSSGLLRVVGNYQIESTAEALAHILEALRLCERLSEREIDDVRQYLVGIAPLANETAADISSQAAALASAGLPSQYVNRHIEALQRPSHEAVNQAFTSHVDPEELTVVITGPAQTIAPELEARGLDFEITDRL